MVDYILLGGGVSGASLTVLYNWLASHLVPDELPGGRGEHSRRTDRVQGREGFLTWLNPTQSGDYSRIGSWGRRMLHIKPMTPEIPKGPHAGPLSPAAPATHRSACFAISTAHMQSATVSIATSEEQTRASITAAVGFNYPCVRRND